jgi:hypothetical protein
LKNLGLRLKKRHTSLNLLEAFRALPWRLTLREVASVIRPLPIISDTLVDRLNKLGMPLVLCGVRELMVERALHGVLAPIIEALLAYKNGK